jgi:membrane fusion protein (multidrug efflux system)
VGRGQNTLLTTISQIDPILFRAGVTEADYLRIAKRDPSRTGTTANETGIELTLADGTLHSQNGKVGPVDRAVDPTTGTLGVQFVFANPQQLLRPGQFGRAKVLIDRKTGALLVPQRAVQELQNLRSVAVVDAENKVAFRNVKTGLRVGQLWVIEDGLKQGERVVVEGLQRIQDGMTVTSKPAPADATASAVPEAVQPAGEAK